jgi:phosphoribosylamine-glycine ligase
MKKIMILGGSHSELPLIQEAKKQGLYVVSVGNILGNGHLESNEYYLKDYSDKELILKLAKTKNIDFICFGAHDLTITTATYVNDKLQLNSNLDDYETTCILHHKDKFKNFAKQNNLTTTDFIISDKIIQKVDLKYPLIIKPIDMGGGKGISIIENNLQLGKAIDLALEFSKEKKVIIEEVFEGKLHSLSVFLIDKQIRFFYVDDEYECKNNKFGVCASLSLAKDFDKIQDNILKEVEKIAKLLYLKNGLLHVQFLQKGEIFSIIEMTRRMPGDFYNIPVELSTNFQYAQNIINSILNKDLNLNFNSKKKLVSRYCLLDENENILNSSHILQRIKLKNSLKKEILILKYHDEKEFLKDIA